MRVTIVAERLPSGKWYTWVRGCEFGVLPVLGDSRAEAIRRARAAVLRGISLAVDSGLIDAPRLVAFETA